MMNPLVSIAMGVYRPKRDYLMESVSSIISQTFEDWELIICNDGDGDPATKALLTDVAALDPRVRVIGYDENKGLAFALNTCIDNARGVFIARQDDDDRSLPQRLEEQLCYLDSYPDCAFVGAEATVFDDKGQWGHIDLVADPMTQSFLWNSPYVHPAVLFRRDVLEVTGGYRVSPETDRVEDYDLFMALAAAGHMGHNIKKDLYEYRIDRDAGKYRPMRARMNEARVRARGFRSLGLGARAFPYVLKPVVLGLVPGKLMDVIRRSRY